MSGLFIGLTTLDLIYLAAQPPAKNQKLVALDYLVSAGGPATNAAIAFAHFGHAAIVLSSLGCHPITHLIRADLQACHVRLRDLSPTKTEPPPVSSIVVTETTGERAVISINAVKTPVSADQVSLELLNDMNIVLIDGHQMAVSQKLAKHAKASGIPVVIDGGSWKPGFEAVLPFADYVICSANFHPPNCQTDADTIAYLQALHIPHIAVTHGDQPIQYSDRGSSGSISVPAIQPVDTLGAGDIFHGAFCHAILETDFVEALTVAAQVAAHSCRYFGTREWMKTTM
ncbi:MAG: sugar kinase [Leptolyngbyaceae cyanobacterium bins.302]|nr:sugar kinase [Leptolyngbyaceae cyanobacterium bins.302]